MSVRFAAALAVGLIAAASALIVLPAAAHDYKLGTLTIDHPWARASAGNAKNGAAFMTIANTGTEPDRLLSATSSVAAKVELHTHMMDSDGVMKMRPVEAIELAPGEVTKLAPGGLHIMLMGLAAPLAEGTSFPATLRFEHAGEFTVDVAVEAVAAMGMDDQGGDHGMGHMNGGTPEGTGGN